MENLKEFKALIKKYRALSPGAIKKAIKAFQFRWEPTMEEVANRLTGFGFTSECSLCIPIEAECSKCTWGPRKWGCMKHATYKAIGKVAQTPEELLAAFRERADYMEEYLETIK
jgi:hypothetical protein